MLLGMFPEKWLFDKSIFSTSFNFPMSSESGPTRELDDKFRSNIYLSSHKEDGIFEVNKLDPNHRNLRATAKVPKQEGIEPESRLPCKTKPARLFS